jgi:threonine aldolase
MPVPVIDLSSDTATRPTAGMRHAMANAEVGDEQRGEDPTVTALEARVAHITGTDAALFMPSGTMCNIVALFVHCRAGDEVILHAHSHVRYSENAGPAVHSRVLLNVISDGADGTFGGEHVIARLQPTGHQKPRTTLVVVENTNNRGGGSVWPLERLEDVTRAARQAGLRTHLDGARLMNAAIASTVTPARLCAGFDSCWVDLTKGLGCPVGAVLAGPEEFIAEARWAKHLFGGAMRQAGIIAAAGLYALDHHVERLADDHRAAGALAHGIVGIHGVELAQHRVDTNIVHFDVGASGRTAEEILERCVAGGVRFGHAHGTVLRAVTHLDVNRADIGAALLGLRRAVET